MTPDTLDTAINAARVVTLCAGVLVALDSLRMWALGAEHPPHNYRQNAGAWFVTALSSLGAGYLLWIDAPVVPGGVTQASKFVVLFIWSSLAIGFTWRAAVRAERPYLTWCFLAVTTGGALAAASVDAWLG